MATLSLTTLFIIIFCLIITSAFFSGSETGMMSINRYRLRHLVREKNKAAIRVQKLLSRTDRLLGVILIGNTFANILASAVATIIAVRLFGDVGIAIASIILTLIVLIFAEITPKTLAALHPQKVSFFTSLPLKILLTILYPVVCLTNSMANACLWLFGLRGNKKHSSDHLSRDELRTLVMESSGRISAEHQDMLLRVLDSEEITVDDVMVPRSDICGIDLDEDWESALKRLSQSEHTRMPVYKDSIDEVKGFINLRKILPLLARGVLDKTMLQELCDDAYFIPEGTPLTTQMINFRKEQQHCALVVDEYGDIQGLVGVEDIIEEIVGEFTTELPSISKLVHEQQGGSYLVDGSVNVRELNRLLEWELPIEEAKTLSGVIIEYLETIPVPNTCVLLNNYPIEIIDVQDNMVKLAKIFPQIKPEVEAD